MCAFVIYLSVVCTNEGTIIILGVIIKPLAAIAEDIVSASNSMQPFSGCSRFFLSHLHIQFLLSRRKSANISCSLNALLPPEIRLVRMTDFIGTCDMSLRQPRILWQCVEQEAPVYIVAFGKSFWSLFLGEMASTGLFTTRELAQFFSCNLAIEFALARRFEASGQALYTRWSCSKCHSGHLDSLLGLSATYLVGAAVSVNEPQTTPPSTP